MSAPLYVFGAGGHGREIAWLARETLGEDADIVFAVDDQYVSGPVHGHPVRPLSEVTGGGATYVVAVGDPALRERAAAACEHAGLTPTTLVHPRVERSASVTLGPGSVVCAGSVLTVDITFGRHVHVNVGCTISHDVVLEDYVTLSPGVHVAGHVTLERGAFVGIGATIVNGSSTERLVIGAGAVVAAGACVTAGVEPGALVAGVPAVRKR